jgi:hypothetical protein
MLAYNNMTNNGKDELVMIKQKKIINPPLPTITAEHFSSMSLNPYPNTHNCGTSS